MEKEELVTPEALKPVETEPVQKKGTKAKGFLIPIIIFTVISTVLAILHWSMFFSMYGQEVDNFGVAVAMIFVVIIYIIPVFLAGIFSLIPFILSIIFLAVNAKHHLKVVVPIVFLVISIILIVSTILGITFIPYMFNAAS